MKAIKRIVAGVVIGLSTLTANAFVVGDWETLFFTGQRDYPSSAFHTICVYSNRVSVVVQGFCPMSIQYNIVTQQWRK